MSIANLFNVPGPSEELAVWSFAHASHHADIVRLLGQQHDFQFASFLLDPFDPGNMEVWLDQHQVMHNQMDAVLGIAGFNLSEVNWKSTDERSQWIWLNAQEHYQAGTILGLG